MSKDRMLRLFHADALDLLNVTNSLKQVCEDLASPTFRMARKVRGLRCFCSLMRLARLNAARQATFW
jgi:hypothetical protein